MNEKLQTLIYIILLVGLWVTLGFESAAIFGLGVNLILNTKNRWMSLSYKYNYKLRLTLKSENGNM